MHKIVKKTLSYSTRKVCLNWIEKNTRTWFIYSPFLSPTISMERQPGDNCSTFSMGRCISSTGVAPGKALKEGSSNSHLGAEPAPCPAVWALPLSSSSCFSRQLPLGWEAAVTHQDKTGTTSGCSQDPRCKFWEYYPNATAAISAQISQKTVEGLTT